MNKNSRRNLNQAKRNAAKGKKESIFVIPKVLSGRGESSNWGSYGSKVINFESMPRKSRYAKVARSGQKTYAEVAQEQEKAIVKEETSRIEKVEKATE